eukprot:CAMPEP_0204093788 /NCGR_PEP_ID=MMETSP0360-20130528/190597_1 /ASSEMBLY_ACC=CAM_ASM_000342 /TAXON_ID=268821 /ORGANISM="Scrippsiella Hangoei, Strain SHTV-5" /LENGTH=95 /DNA_ID=CAMNT_0051043091 /DNA_START=438 /DNA_END=726 /DNA_ORIENTATION=+
MAKYSIVSFATADDSVDSHLNGLFDAIYDSFEIAAWQLPQSAKVACTKTLLWNDARDPFDRSLICPPSSPESCSQGGLTTMNEVRLFQLSHCWAE